MKVQGSLNSYHQAIYEFHSIFWKLLDESKFYWFFVLNAPRSAKTPSGSGIQNESYNSLKWEESLPIIYIVMEALKARVDKIVKSILLINKMISSNCQM